MISYGCNPFDALQTSSCANIMEIRRTVESDVGHMLTLSPAVLSFLARLRLILPDLTAIGVRLSHASQPERVADGSVTRSQPALGTWKTSGN